MGHYTLDGRIGEGGQGTVYLATAPGGTRVAVKLMRSDLAGDAEASARFVREVEPARRVAPFCTAQVVETGLFGDRPYVVSEYVDGPSLAEAVRAEGPRSGASLHRLAVGTLTALLAVHQAGIVHRDFKPSNVLLGSDGPRVIDFGIARALDLTSSLTAGAVGTPSFMAPEQLTDAAPGPAADMFAWACTLLYAASGQPPFGHDSLPDVVHRIADAEPDVGCVADPELRALVTECLAKDPARRPRAGDALTRLLGRGPSPALLQEGAAAAASGTPAQVPPAGPPQQQPAPAQSHPGHPSHGAAPNGHQPPYGAPNGHQPPYGHQPPGGAPNGHPPPGGVPNGHLPPGGVPYGHLAQGGGYHGAGGPRQGGPQAFAAPPARPGGPAPIDVPKSGRRGMGMIIAATVAAVVVLAGAGVFTAVRFAAAPAPTPAPSASPSASSPAPAETASGPLPAAGTAMALPGTSVTVHEDAADPLKLASYSVGGGKRVYVRRPGTPSFTRDSRYFEYALDATGTRALAIDVEYTRDHHAQVSIVDHRTGDRRRVKLSRAPVFPTTPRWSPDGRRGLVTLYRATDGASVEHGFGVIDVARGTGRTFRIRQKGAGEWRFFWAADGRAVGTWVGGTMTFYDLKGRQIRKLTGRGSPIWVEGEDVSPSGELFVASCPAARRTICAYPTTGAGEAAEPRVVPFDGTRLIGWWDDAHLAGWRPEGGGYEAVVVDMRGQVTRVLATARSKAELDAMGFRFSRGTP
ncbi:protein kinase domain-containing protein [Nonomuraea indica]|uniref:Protein kinase n=1 Tax=Nonomuraea indica TaxID=1581193 RepID=A0ABW8A6C7_9ACTN